MKTIKKLCCVLLVFAVVMSLGVTAFAENKYENSAGLTPVDGTSLTFKKFLIIGAGDNVPNVTFSYTIAAGTCRNYCDDRFHRDWDGSSGTVCGDLFQR